MKKGKSEIVQFILRLPKDLDRQIKELVVKKKDEKRNYSANKYLIELIEKDMKNIENSKGGRNGKK